MTFFILATVRQPPPPPEAVRLDSRDVWFESLDGTRKVSIPRPQHARVLRLLAGATGLGVAPSDLSIGGAPGVPGGFVEDVTYPVRTVQLPFAVRSRTQAEQWEVVQQLRDLTDPEEATRDAGFYLVCDSASGRRRLGLVYESGLEGAGRDTPFHDEFVLTCQAPQPFPEDLEETVVEYTVAASDAGFLAASASDPLALPFQELTLAPSDVIGEDMQLVMTSERPVHPWVEIVGPADSVLMTASTGLRIDVPTGVAAGSVLRIVADPRGASIRLNGAAAAGKLARGSRRAPFTKGTNVLDVAAPGATAATKIRMGWRGKYRGLT
ncbi:hypothetical protein IF650_13030 [Cellulosimicrobium terreum]|nr:hypothetical protein [Cellulosimicrobium terreum]